MKNHILTFTTILFFITSVFFGVKFYLCTHREPSKLSLPMQIDSNATISPTIVYRDTQGIEHTVIDNNINSIIEGEATRAAKELQPVIEQAAENLNIKPSQVEGVTSISVKATRDSLAFIKKQLENAQKLTFYYKDKYLTLNVNTNPLDSTDLGSFGYTYNADLNIVQYYKKSWFLGAKKSYIDISSNDRNATVMGVKKFTVKQQEPEFGIRLQGTVGHNFITGNTSVGPSIRLDFGNKIKGSIKASALYNIQEQKVGTSITFDKDLKRF